MTKPWADKLRKIKPYIPGEQPETENIIKLNANENPYPPSPNVVNLIKNFNSENLKCYPDSNSTKLIEALAKYHDVDKSQVFVGNGSDDVLALSFMSFFNSEKEILFPDITYSFYNVWCSLLNVPYKTIPVDENFKINPKDFYETNGGVIIPNPNAPTGIKEGKDFVVEILENNKDSIVIIDEAYVDFGGYSSVELIKDYENLIVVKTFSKSRSLAGLRIGVAIGNSELISVLNAVKNSYNSYPLDSISIEAAIASLNDEEYFKSTIDKIINTREKTVDSLRNLGFSVCPSSTNFIFASHPKIAATDILNYLKKNNIYVRHFDLPRISDYLRITVGTDYEMDCLIEKINELIK